METVTHDNLPSAVAKFFERFDRIELLIKTLKAPAHSDEWFNIDQAVAYLPGNLSKATIYRYTKDRLIPFHKDRKKLRFLKSELDQWLKLGRQKTSAETAAETDAEVDAYLSKK